MIGGAGVETTSNELYGKVKGGEGEEGYELVDIPPRYPPPLVEMYEVRSFPPPPSQPLPSFPPPPTPAEEETVYDIIPGDQ